MSPVYLDFTIALSPAPCELRPPVSDRPEQIKIQRTMLIIDDQQSVRVSLEYLLGLTGYRVIGADSGASGIALAANEPIDGALIDVHMPVMNGFETCQRLQAQASAHGLMLRIWFMTGAPSNAVVRRASELGTFGVFGKPFDYPAFLAQLEQGFSSPVPLAPPLAVAPADSDDGRIAPP